MSEESAQAGRSRGRKTALKQRQGEAPKLRAASSSALGIRERVAATISWT